MIKLDEVNKDEVCNQQITRGRRKERPIKHNTGRWTTSKKGMRDQEITNMRKESDRKSGSCNECIPICYLIFSRSTNSR